jgi:hypothetical protein
MTFLGICRWFETKGLAKKEIPSAVVDVGCKYHRPRDAEERDVVECGQLLDAARGTD